jgi:uroporphyrinogen-III synthase
VKPSVFIPAAEGGRTGIRDRLRELGCEVISVPLYRTLPREDLARLLSRDQLEKAALILFTSPSSFDAFTRVFTVPSHVRVASVGRFTARHLQQKGFTDQRMLPEGDFGRIGEVLS